MFHFTPPDPLTEGHPTKRRQRRLDNYLALMAASGYRVRYRRGRPSKAYRVENLTAAAIGMLAFHPGWTDRAIADYLGCSPSALSQNDLYRRARTALEMGRLERSRGYKDRNGRLEAWSADDDAAMSSRRKRFRRWKRPDETENQALKQPETGEGVEQVEGCTTY